jgi:ribonuclease D
MAAPAAGLDAGGFGVGFFCPRALTGGVIDTGVKLGAFLPQLAGAAWVAMDTEADSLHCYPEKLCLVQMSVPGQDVLIDPLADLDLAPLWGALNGREIILHGGDYDLRLLRRGPGFIPHAVFDTMLAARLLGEPAFGLQSLVRGRLGVELEKGPQKANWSMRPLSPRLLSYAENDTRHLKALADALRAALEAAGRLGWHAQMCGQLLAEASVVVPEDPDQVWRLGGSDRLDRRGLAVLRELCQWREAEAIAANRPLFFVMNHDLVLEIAAAAARGAALEPLMPRRLSDRRRQGLLAAVQRAGELPEDRLPHPRKRHGKRLSMTARNRLEALKQHRDRLATQWKIDPSLIASKATLVELAADWDAHAPALLPWQREALAR